MILYYYRGDHMEERNRSHNMILTLLVALTLVVILLYQTTFAKYKKEVNGRIEADVADWNIKINNEDIRGKTTLTNSIVPTFPGDSYTKAGVIAPGTSGYFDLNIDATNADVNFAYTITATSDTTSDVRDIVIESYKIGNGAVTPYTAAGIQGSITHNTASNPITVYITWNDGYGQTMDNVNDTTAGANDNSVGGVNVEIHLIQSRT